MGARELNDRVTDLGNKMRAASDALTDAINDDRYGSDDMMEVAEYRADVADARNAYLHACVVYDEAIVEWIEASEEEG